MDKPQESFFGIAYLEKVPALFQRLFFEFQDLHNRF